MIEPRRDEAWGFEWGDADGHGGFVRLALHRADRVAWFWAYLWRPDDGPVAVRDHAVSLPRGKALEIRADALWSELVCETPGEHWSIGLEAFGVGLDRASDRVGDEIGERVALGFDFEWETAGELFVADIAGVGREIQPGIVRGEVLLGRDRIPLDTVGTFAHSVGDAERLSDLHRSTTAWPDGSWDASLRVGAQSRAAHWDADGAVQPPEGSVDGLGVGAEFSVRSVATIHDGERRVVREIGAVSSAGGRGTGWMESISESRAKIT